METGKTAFIIGITGQDGSYLAEFLLGKGYSVHGLVRWDAVDGTQRLKDSGILEKITKLADGLRQTCQWFEAQEAIEKAA